MGLHKIINLKNMHCPNCNEENVSTAKFCKKCGEQFNDTLIEKNNFTKKQKLIASVLVGVLVVFIFGGFALNKVSKNVMENLPRTVLGNKPFSNKSTQTPNTNETTIKDSASITLNPSDNKNTTTNTQTDAVENHKLQDKYREVSIKNYDKLLHDLPINNRIGINIGLYNMVQRNSGKSDFDTTDAYIKEGSNEIKYDENIDVHFGSFIVVIPGVDESFNVAFRWSTNPKNDYVGALSTIECLPNNTPGSFKDCSDDFSKSPDNINRDPIMKFLPHHNPTNNYNITADVGNDNKVSLNIDINLLGSDIRNYGREQSILKYKQQAEEWLKSNSFTGYPTNYIIK